MSDHQGQSTPRDKKINKMQREDSLAGQITSD